MDRTASSTNVPAAYNVPVWDGGGRTPLPHLRGEVSADVCVIGLGGSGLTAVGALLRRSLRVVGIDAGAVGGGAQRRLPPGRARRVPPRRGVGAGPGARRAPLPADRG